IMTNLIYKPLNMIDFNTYNVIKYGAPPVAISSVIASVQASNNPYLLGLATISMLLNLYVSLPDAIYNVKELKELYSMLQDFLHNYHQLNSTFNMGTPLETMLLYTKLLHQGYLSQDKHHTSSYSRNVDSDLLNAFYPFTGESVCRHQGTLLRDILQNEGFKSMILLNKPVQCSIDEEAIESSPELKEFEYFFETHELPTEEELKDIFARVERLIASGNLSLENLHLEGKKEGMSHLITISNYNGQNYYLDSTNKIILRRRIIDGTLVLGNGLEAYVPATSFIYSTEYSNRHEKLSKIKKLLTANSADVTLEEEQAARDKIDTIWRDNPDIFDHFYNDNQELYSEITNKLIRVRQKLDIPTRKKAHEE
ncbi:MAG: hypothetical protein K2J20_04170, partial [Bacilli bacterium]|nr:hypothetical protein [Bacilli bacterium]